MKVLFLTICVLLTLLSASAQTADTTKARQNRPASPNDQRTIYETYQSTNQVVGSGGNILINAIDNRYEGLRGTPYFLPEWHKGQIEMVAGPHYQEVPIKFDAYRQHLILLRPRSGNDSIIVNASQVKSFQFRNDAGQVYTFRRIPTAKTNDEALKEGYFLVLYQDKSALLKRIVKTIKTADYKNPYSEGTRYDEFRNAVSYYILKPDQTLEKVKLSDKAIIDALGAHTDELKAFAKQNNLSGKTENDAIQLVQKYDSF